MRNKDKKIYNKDKKYSSKKRLLIIMSIFGCLFTFLIIRLIDVMLIRGREYSAKAYDAWRNTESITAKRGNILDRNGSVLVATANVYTVEIDLEAIKNHLKEHELTNEDIANDIAAAVGISKEEVLKCLNTKDVRTVILARGVNKEIADKVKELDIWGVKILDDIKRYYPNGNFLANTLGGINSEGVGLTGIELEYDDYLAGIEGMEVGGIDKNGDTLSLVPYEFTPAIDGKDVILTVDENLQYIAEEIAEKGLNQHKAKGVQVLIMDPNTGEILAMASKPDYNPNEPFEGYETFEGENDNDKIQNMWRNRIISDTFEPGSTFKTITMIAALEEGVAKDSDTFVCNGGVKFGDTYVKCWNTAGHGKQTLAETLKNSCNVGFMELGSRLGVEKLNEYIYKLGFGKLTGIDLSGEAEGIVKANKDVSEIDLATIAFGQTNTVTAIQLLTAFNAIANGGDLIQPHIVKEISHEDKSGTRLIEETITPTIKKNVLSKDNTTILRGYLERTATQDGAPGSFVQGYNVGGKTGTAQKVDTKTGGYSADKYIASMVALAPVDNPEITAFIAVDEPGTGVYYGGQVASPLMKELFAKIFEYMDSPLAKERFSIAKNVIIPDVRGKSLEEAKEILNKNNLDFDITGKGDIVTSMDSYPGSTVKEGTKIVLTAKKNGKIEDDIIMPDLKGNNKEFAISILNNLGLTYVVDGDGIVYSQSINTGIKVKKGSKVSLVLKNQSEY